MTYRSPLSGFTLVEVAVALVLLELLLLGALALLHGAARTTASALLLERATWEAMSAADAFTGMGSAQSARPWGTLAWETGVVVARDSAGVELVRLPVVEPVR